MKNPMREDSPAWCEIRRLQRGVGIEVAVHCSFIKSWNKLSWPKEAPKKPSWPQGSRIRGDWSVWRFKYPRDVMGKGRKEAWRIRLLLYELFIHINTVHAFGCRSLAKSCQLLFIEYFSVVKELKGGLFTVIICPSLGEWIAVQSKKPPACYAEEITKKMLKAANHMAKGQNWDWVALVGQDGRVAFSGAGGTILCTSIQDFSEDRFGQRLTSDNIDGSYEQLVLLYAVAALHDLARENGAV